MARSLRASACFNLLTAIVLVCLGLQRVQADAIRIVTEELPPYNMTRDGRITGMSTEVVEAVLKEIGVDASIQSMPWARAYDLAMNADNVLIYSIARTPQREKLFNWVGVIAPTRWYLYALPERRITIGKLDEALLLQTATVQEDVGEQYLLAHGFVVGTNLQSSTKYQFNYEKLKSGHVDLWISNELAAYYLARQAGDDPTKTLARALSLSDLDPDGGLNMAFSLKTPEATVQRFREGLKIIRSNGIYDSIAKKWL